MKPATSRVHWHYHYSCTSVSGPKALSLNEHTQSQGPGSPLICCKSLPLSLPLNHRCTDNHTLHLHSTDAPLHWVVHFSREKEFSSLLSMQLYFNSFQNVSNNNNKKSKCLSYKVCMNLCKGSVVQRKDMTRSSLILNVSRTPGSGRYMVTQLLFFSHPFSITR